MWTRVEITQVTKHVATGAVQIEAKPAMLHESEWRLSGMVAPESPDRPWADALRVGDRITLLLTRSNRGRE